MVNSRIKRKKQRRKRLKKKALLLAFLTVMLFAVVVVYQFDSGRKESLQQISSANINGESKSNEDNETNEIEFNTDHIENENEYINVLLVGVDAEEGNQARTDTIMVAQYHPKEGIAKLVSIMRDTYVSIPGYRDNKINSSFFFGGPELLRKTIKENFNIDVEYYAMVNFDGFVQVVDTIAPSGIDIDIANRMYYHDPYADLTIDFQPGEQTLDGQETLNYVRFRSDSENDFGRVRRQQEVLDLLKDELLSFSGITRIPKLVGTIDPYVDTNIQGSKILSLGRDFFLNPIEEVETLTIPIDGGYVDDRVAHAGAILKPDLEKNKQALDDFFSIEDDTLSAVNDQEREKEKDTEDNT
ncbi:LCP family protein [Desertibacillus haloalkaliphilus]|uniref:LCP family protein n=1 Tax=Desertibacillus haloalkaliphilus TaxID=1328930 RepID=UPI001FE9C10A|nr:LCP family protein [Desertibacillus haloalkaliphilus]